MKKIGLYLGVEPHAGGMFQYAQSLLDALQALPKDAYQVYVAYSNPRWQEQLAPYPFDASYLNQHKFGELLSQGMMALCIPAPLARIISRIASPIYRALNKAAADLWIFPAQEALAYQMPFRCIATIHDLMHRYEPHFPEVASGWRTPIREHRFSSICRYAHAIVVDSEVGKQHAIESYGAQAGKIFPLPFVPPRYIFEALTPEDFNEKYMLPAKYLFYPAQFWAHKNHARLLRAAASILPDCPDLQLVFTGGKRHEYAQVHALADALGLGAHVTFAGYVPDAYVPEFYRRARALVMPTFFGPTNIPPLEAMACGCPVAISGTYGMPEQSGDAALYFEPTSEPEIADVMRRLWQDEALCQTLIANGRKKLAQWSQPQFNQRLEEILRQC